MMPVKEFRPSFIGDPTDDELKEGIEIANAEQCIVRIGHVGRHGIEIAPGMTLEECKERINKQLYI